MIPLLNSTGNPLMKTPLEGKPNEKCPFRATTTHMDVQLTARGTRQAGAGVPDVGDGVAVGLGGRPKKGGRMGSVHVELTGVSGRIALHQTEPAA